MDEVEDEEDEDGDEDGEVSVRSDELSRKSCVTAMPMEAKESEVRSQARKVRSVWCVSGFGERVSLCRVDDAAVLVWGWGKHGIIVLPCLLLFFPVPWPMQSTFTQQDALVVEVVNERKLRSLPKAR